MLGSIKRCPRRNGTSVLLTLQEGTPSFKAQAPV